MDVRVDVRVKVLEAMITKWGVLPINIGPPSPATSREAALILLFETVDGENVLALHLKAHDTRHRVDPITAEALLRTCTHHGKWVQHYPLFWRWCNNEHPFRRVLWVDLAEHPQLKTVAAY